VSKEQVITVLNPQGNPPLVRRKPMAPRLDTLDGKRVYLVDVRFNDGDILLQQIKSWFEENMPRVNPVFVKKSGVYTYDDKELWREIGEEGDAVIMAIGH
jgi:hypothetical protein